MKRIAILLSLGILLPGTAWSQDNAAPSPPSLPPGPLLRRAPAMSKWTIVHQRAANKLAPPQPTESGQQGKKEDPTKSTPFKQVTVTKTGAVICENVLDERGRRFDIWHSSGRRIVLEGAEAPIITEDSGESDMQTVNFTTSDFAGFSWITEQSFAGIQKVMGKDCIILKGEVDPATPQELFERQTLAEMQRRSLQQSGSASAAPTPPPNYKVPVVACIELETRMPVSLAFGKGANLETRLFRFEEAPTNMLSLPANLQSSVGQYNKRIQDLSRRPAPP